MSGNVLFPFRNELFPFGNLLLASGINKLALEFFIGD